MTRNLTLLVTGAGGQLGTDLLLAASRMPFNAIGVTRADLDITNSGAVREAVTAHQPDVIINCAAWTAVDDCEDDPQRAHAINGHAVGNLVAAADEAGSHVIHISTDFVFDGSKPEPYLEDDQPNPRNVYGVSKLVGEQAAADHTVIRVSWLNGLHGGRIIRTILRLAEERDTFSFVNDTFGYPSFTADLAPAILGIADKGPLGMLHLTNQGRATWYDVAQEVMRLAGHDPARVLPVPGAEFAQKAERPKNSCLENARWRDDNLGPMLPDWQSGLADLVSELQK